MAWVGTHRHDAQGRNEAYAFTHVFRVSLALPEGARTLALPEDDGVRLLGASVLRRDNGGVRPATPLIERPVAALVR